MKFLAFAVLLAAVPALASPDPRALSSFDFDGSAVLPRVRTIPPWLLEEWKRADGMPYKAHAVTPSDLKTLNDAYAGLPAPMRKTLSERLIAVYLVDGLKGNGITDWVLDASSRPYAYTILNAAGLKNSLSDLLTERDRSLFREPAPVSVSAGDAPGILYTVAHEAAHAVDYVRAITPYTEVGEFKALHPGKSTDASWDAWKGYFEPKPDADYPLRSKLHFYGFGAAELAASEAGELCAQWAKSPFASPYGSRSWAEDFAELFVLRHLSEDKGMTVRRVCDGKTYEPWANKALRKRAMKLTAPLYR